jgi:hypothetical protein
MKRSGFMGVVIGLVVGVTSSACTNAKDRASVIALEGLRGAVETRGDTARFGDSRVLTEAMILARAVGIERSSGVPLGESAHDIMLGDVRAQVEPEAYWRGARVYLRPGRCEKIEDVSLPPEARVPEQSSSWRAAVRSRHEKIARRLTNAFAADFRCGEGPRFTAIFSRPEPDDGTLRVARISASIRGR